MNKQGFKYSNEFENVIENLVNNYYFRVCYSKYLQHTNDFDNLKIIKTINWLFLLQVWLRLSNSGSFYVTCLETRWHLWEKKNNNRISSQISVKVFCAGNDENINTPMRKITKHIILYLWIDLQINQKTIEGLMLWNSNRQKNSFHWK